MLITREWLQEQRACYDDRKIDELAAGRPSITIGELLELQIPYPDKMWVLFRMLTVEQLKEFAQSCVDAAAEYDVNIDLAARYNDEYVELTADCNECMERSECADRINLAVATIVADEVAITAASSAAAMKINGQIEERERQINWLKGALK